MPIRPDALPTPEPDDQTPSAPEEPAKKRRRTKAEMIADAVIPGDAELVEIKDVNTGAKVQRAWREAVDLVNSGAMEFTDREHGYALKKQAQQESAPAVDQGEPAETPLPQAEADRATYVENLEQPQAAPADAPPAAALGDHVIVGSETYSVGHGGVLTSSAVADADGNIVKPKRLWQRELGTGSNGPWESVAMRQDAPKPIFDPKPAAEAESAKPIIPEQNGNGGDPNITVETQNLPCTIEEIEGTQFVKIGTGILEKIGLPKADQFDSGSSLQVGPITMSRTIIDDGRRTPHTFSDGRTGEIITAAAEGFELLDNTCEFIAARFRGQMQSFLQATGVIKQTVS